MKKIIALSIALLLGIGPAFAQQGVQLPAGQFLGNNTASARPAFAVGFGSMFDRFFNAGQGMVLNRGAGASNWTATRSPIIGLNGTATGTLGFAGVTSGTATITPQAVAGTPTLTLPSASGTFAVNAAAPLVLNAATGALSITSAALTKVDDANVTVTLGGTPASALLAATSITLGWNGQLSLARGGTGASLAATGGASQVVQQTSTGAALTVGQLAAANLSNGVTGTGAVALAASPALTGTPTAPTAAPGTNTTQIASTAFVTTAVTGSVAGVSSINGLTGAVTTGLAPPGGRLTTVSGGCVITTDVVAATVLYYAPCLNPYIPIYNGTNVQSYNFTASLTDSVGLSLALGSNWLVNTSYDVFVTLSGGVPKLCTVPWATTVAGASTRTTALSVIAGLMVNDTTATCRDTNSTTLSVAAGQGTFLGTVLVLNAGQIDMKFGNGAAGGGIASFGIWNMYNRTLGVAAVLDTGPPWNVIALSTYEPMNNSTNNRVRLVAGLAGDIADTTLGLPMQSNSGGSFIGVALNVTNAMSPRCQWGQQGVVSTSTIQVVSNCALYPVAGLNFIQAVQWSNSATANFYGNSGGQNQQGMLTRWWW